MPARWFLQSCCNNLREPSIAEDGHDIPIAVHRFPYIWLFSSMPSIRRQGRFRNFLAYNRRWIEGNGSVREDCHGRALWALGTVLGRSEDHGLRGAAGRLFEYSLPAAVEFQQSARLRLHPVSEFRNISLRIPETATPREYDRHSRSDCSRCTSRSDARIGIGLKMFLPTATQDCRKPCSWWARLAQMIA